MKSIFFPGSKESVAIGCICDQKINHYGDGNGFLKNGEEMFTINQKCPVHGYLLGDSDGRKNDA